MSPEKAFPVVCIGASAGGLEAVTALFRSLPRDLNMAFVLIQHLEPHHKSILAEILSRETSLKIQQAKNRTRVRSGNVYVIPPNSYLSISRRTLKITPRTRHRGGKYLPVDYFMASLASDHGKKAVGVILSGTGSDGMRGVKAIKAKGGITFAQDAKTAKYDGMPLAAIASGKIDFVLGPAAIARKLMSIAAKRRVDLKQAAPHLRKEEVLDRILLLLRDLSGVDFIHYKRPTLERRIMRRMGFHGFKTLNEYYKYLQKNTPEAQALYKDVLIPVTMFFRDPGIFPVIKNKLLPRIIKGLASEDPIRVWVPACSTGEEVYSIAITIYEFLEENNIKPRMQIFGTDLSDTQIEKARLASYPDNISAHVTPFRLRRFFTRTDTGYKIVKHIRDMCIFAKQDITSDPPFSNMDIISCRNLLIYLDAMLQKKVLSVLYYALKPEAFLILGTAESLTSMSDFFTVINKKFRIYSKDITAQSLFIARVPAAMKPEAAGGKSGAFNDRERGPVSGKRRSHASASKLVKTEHHASKIAAPSRESPAYEKWDVKKFKKELIESKRRLHAIIEEKDAVNEELRAANEEIQSGNEELQSTNEELETSKEELQSSNEELITVNEELQNTNTQLTQLNSDLANVLTSVNIPLIIVKTNLRIMRFTPTARKVMNLIPTDVGRPIGDIKLNINIPDIEKIILDVIESITPAEFDVTDGSGRWYSMRIRPYKTTDNKIDGAVISLIDIDFMKRAQNEIQDALDYAASIVETVREPLLVLDGNLRVVSANKSFYNMFAVTARDIDNKPIDKVCGSRFNVSPLPAALKVVLSKKAHFENLEVTVDLEKAGERILSFNARQVFLRGKERHMILLAIEDITERRKNDDILKRDKNTLKKLVSKQTRDLMDAHLALASAERLSDIGTLAATVAHELRNPLASIGMAVRNLKKKVSDSELYKHLGTIERKILESDAIINNLLFYSHLKPPNYESINIFDMLEESIEGLEGRCRQGVSLTKKIDNLKNIQVEADPTQVKEMFNNLLNNAYDALPPAGGDIEISGSNGGESIRIVIKDNGSGMNEIVLNKMFDPFYTTKAKGTGLGLSVCKQIVNLYGGKITVESELGKGTSVSVILPKKREKT